MHNYPERKTFLVFRNTLSSVNIEQLYVLNEGRQLPFQAIEQGLQGQIVIDHDRQVADHRRKPGDLGVGGNIRRLECSEIEFEDHRRLWQIVLLRPFGMQFADATDLPVLEQNAGSAARIVRAAP